MFVTDPSLAAACVVNADIPNDLHSLMGTFLENLLALDKFVHPVPIYAQNDLTDGMESTRHAAPGSSLTREQASVSLRALISPQQIKQQGPDSFMLSRKRTSRKCVFAYHFSFLRFHSTIVADRMFLSLL